MLPITFNVVDTETTDLEPEAELVEIASCLMVLTEDRETIIDDPWTKLFKPGRHIGPGARSVHHITVDDLVSCHPAGPDDRKAFCQRTEGGESYAPAQIMVAHNCRFEQQFFSDEDTGGLPWICTYKVALRVFPEAPTHSNGGLYYWLQDQGLMPNLGDLAHPMHRAGPDTYISAHILRILLDRATVDEMIQWTSEPRLLPTCPIGDQWRGKPWADVEFGFLKWMVGKEGLDPDFRWNAKREVERRAGGGQRGLI